MIPHTKVPGKPSWSYSQDGVYRLVGTGENVKEVEVIDWCPIVKRYVVTKDSRAKITTARYTIAVNGHEDTVYSEELRSGEGWDRFPDAVGHDDRQVRDTLAIIVRHQARDLPQTVAAPYWDGDRLVLSDPDLMPAGYGENTHSDPAELFTVAAVNPKLALIIGLSYGSPYVEPLNRQPFWTHIVGEARQGKSTGMNAAASPWGKPRPSGVVLPWNTTTNGLPAALGELAILPAFMDDLHAAGLTPSQIRKLIFSTVEGNSRLRSTRGGRRKDSPPWYGVLFSTGNDSILGMLPQPEVAARVVEITSPIVADSATSKWVKSWARHNYGWHRPVPIVTMRAAIDQAESMLRGEIDGGTEETILENLALGVAGAYLVGGESLGDAAQHAAREMLDRLKAELVESGVRSGDRLREAIRQALVSRSSAFPTRDQYKLGIIRGERAAALVEGFWEPPVAYIITSKLAGIAAAYGVLEIRVPLRDLKTRELLQTQASANQLRKQIRTATGVVDTYAVVLEAGEETSSNVPRESNFTSDTSVTSDTAGQTAWNPSLVPYPEPVTAEVSAAHGANGNSAAPVTPQVRATIAPVEPEPAKAAVTAPEPVTPQVNGSQVDKPGRVATGVRSSPPREPGVTGAARRRPVRSVSVSTAAEDAEEWQQVSAIIRAEWPDATPEQVLAALKMFRTRVSVQGEGLRHIGTSAIAGQLLFHLIMRRYGSIPEMIPGGLEGLEDLQIRRSFNFVDTTAEVASHPWVMGLDVNAQFLSVCGSVELGTGYAEPVKVPALNDPRAARAYFRRPGYVQLSEPHTLAGACVLDAGEWVAHPVGGYLAERGRLRVERDGFIWPESRRWLQKWGEVLRTGRNVLVDAAEEDLPSAMALHLVKGVYAAFLGGYLRSTDHNRALTQRSDWNDQIVSLARVNMLRAVDQANPAPFASHADMAYFLLQDSQVIEGLTISTQAGKWKVARTGAAQDPATIVRGGHEIHTSLAEQVAAGSVAGVRDVVSDLNHQRERVTS